MSIIVTKFLASGMYLTYTLLGWLAIKSFTTDQPDIYQVYREDKVFVIEY